MRKIFPVILLGVGMWGVSYATPNENRPEKQPKPQVIRLDFSVSSEGNGGVLAVDLDGDGIRDFLVTTPGHIGAYKVGGEKMWHLEKEIYFSGFRNGCILPGLHAPGVQVADVIDDGDGKVELLYLDPESTVHILEGETGREKRSVRVPPPEGAARWESVVVANLRGRGDRDVILQAANPEGYAMGRYLAAWAVENLDGEPLWATDQFGALAHGPSRVVDLDGDGRDEIIGRTILGPDGKQPSWAYPPVSKDFGDGKTFHVDSAFFYDIRPDVAGLEVVLLEEGRNYVGLVNFEKGLLWWETHRGWEPQNAAVGEFDLARPGLEIWCRSRFDTHQKPWVMDSRGKVISAYEMDDVAPEGWTVHGVDVIAPIHWTGGQVQLAAAKERHEGGGDVCLFEPISGRFVLHLREEASRIYVADVTGDWREEIIVWNEDELHIYENPAPNPRPNQPRLWKQQSYRRAKMTWDYYSP